MGHIKYLMSNKDYNKVVAIEKAIKEKYGEEAIANPRTNWDENKEKDYLEQMKELYNRKKLSCLWYFSKKCQGRCIINKI